jgi:hypothetical protein
LDGKDSGEIPKAGTLREAGRGEDKKLVGEGRLSKKLGRSWNKLRFLAADRS